MNANADPTSTFDKRPSPWALRFAIFGGVALVTAGILRFLEGVSAVAGDQQFTTPDYAFAFDLTAWGWIHMIIGGIGILVGAAILAGQAWGYAVGILVAVVSGLGSFAFMPYYPVWSLVLLAFDIAVMWALTEVLRSSH